MSWLKPYLRTWYQQYPESVPPVRQIAHYMKPLEKAHPAERIVTELAAYLTKTPPQYLNLAKFAATFGSWAIPESLLPARPEPVAPMTKRVVVQTSAGRARLQEVGLDDPRPAA